MVCMQWAIMLSQALHNYRIANFKIVGGADMHLGHK